jgi:hypothetical protein
MLKRKFNGWILEIGWRVKGVFWVVGPSSLIGGHKFKGSPLTFLDHVCPYLPPLPPYLSGVTPSPGIEKS